jgi:hypothetical protein
MSVVSQSPTDDSPPVSPSTEKKASRWARIKTKTQDLQATLDMANLTNDLSERGIDFQKLKARFPEPDHGILINGDSDPHKKTLRRRKTVQFTEESAPEGFHKFTCASLKEKYKRRDTM